MQIQAINMLCFKGEKQINKFAKVASKKIEAEKLTVQSEISKAKELNQYALKLPRTVFQDSHVEMSGNEDGTISAKVYSKKTLKKEIDYTLDENNELNVTSILEYIPRSKKVNLYLYGNDEIMVSKGLKTNKKGEKSCDECIKYRNDYYYYYLKNVKQDGNECKVKVKSGIGYEYGSNFAYRNIKTNEDKQVRAEEKILFDDEYKPIEGYDREKVYIALNSDKLEEVKF